WPRFHSRSRPALRRTESEGQSRPTPHGRRERPPTWEQAAAVAVGTRWASPQLPRSADPRPVLNSSLAPELVEPRGNAEFRAGAHIAIEGLAVIANRLDDPDHPILGQAELFAKIAVGAECPFQLGLIRFRHVVDVLLGNAEFLGIYHRKQHPLDEVEP